MEIIYCAAGNRRFADIALEAGMLYGAQLPGTVYHPPYFVDQNWKQPDLPRYRDAIAAVRPYMATVLDWERQVPLAEVLGWAEEIAPFVNEIIIIPKVVGGVSHIPHRIAGRFVRLGFSVPTRHGATAVHPLEFAGRPVHLLGGSPQRQMKLSKVLNAKSADGNYIQKVALKWCCFWVRRTKTYASHRWFPNLQEAGLYTETDAPYVAFRLSAQNTMAAWRAVIADDYSDLPLFAS